MSSTSSLSHSSFNEQPPGNPQADTNKDGVVNLFDLVFVVEHLNQNAAAPAQLRFIESIPSSAKEVIAAQRALSRVRGDPQQITRAFDSPSNCYDTTYPLLTGTSERPNSCPTTPTRSIQTPGYRISYPKPLQSPSKSTM